MKTQLRKQQNFREQTCDIGIIVIDQVKLFLLYIMPPLEVFLLLFTVYHIVLVVGDIGTTGGVAYLVASLCPIMSSLLKADLP